MGKRLTATQTQTAPTRNKFGACKAQVNGVTFDSKAESEFYLWLLAQKQAGEIESIILQPRYELQPRQIINRTEVIAPIDYVADFEVRYPDGTVRVMDVKGKETDVYKLKAKLFRAKYPDLPLVVVKRSGKGWTET